MMANLSWKKHKMQYALSNRTSDQGFRCAHLGWTLYSGGLGGIDEKSWEKMTWNSLPEKSMGVAHLEVQKCQVVYELQLFAVLQGVK